MKITRLEIPDILLVQPEVFRDARGLFLEAWQHKVFAQAGIGPDFVQDNHSRSVRGTLRGLHYQAGRPQGKLVRVTRGCVFDVAVDIRPGSPTFGRWVGEYLNGEQMNMLWVPPGFAHGFYVVSDTADFQYKCTDYYTPEEERCIRWNDPTLRIYWPIKPDETPLLSEKDSRGGSILENCPSEVG